MNDTDWFKKFRRGPRGGCTVWAVLFIAVGLGLAL
jgi:hypothetical protein